MDIVKKWFIRTIVVFITFILVPNYFADHKEHCFFFAVLCSIATLIHMSMFFYKSFHKDSDKKKLNFHHVKISITLTINVLMAYQLYNWNELTNIFPLLMQISDSTTILFFICLPLAIGLIGGILFLAHNILVQDNNSKKQNTPTVVNKVLSSDDSTITNSIHNLNVPFHNGTPTNNEQQTTNSTNSSNTDTSDNPIITLRHILGYIISFIAILALSAFICYILITNQELKQHFQVTSLENMLNVFLLLLSTIALVLITTWVIILALKHLTNLILTTCTNTKSTTYLHDDSFIKLVSTFILIIIYILLPDINIDQFFSFMIEPKEAAPILKGVVMLVGSLIFIQLISKLLRVFLNPPQKLKNNTNKLFEILWNTVFDVIKDLVSFTKIIPDFTTSFRMLVLDDEDEECEEIPETTHTSKTESSTNDIT